MPTRIEIVEFARRVERLCDFLISQAEKNGDEDILVLQELKEEAANLQFSRVDLVSLTIDGLSEYMKGASIS